MPAQYNALCRILLLWVSLFFIADPMIAVATLPTQEETTSTDPVPDRDKILGILSEASETISFVGKSNGVWWSSTQIVGEQQIRIDDLDGATALAEKHARPGHWSLAIVREVADVHVQRCEYDKAIELMGLIQQIEERGAETSQYHCRDITRQIVRNYGVAGDYSDALDLIQQLPIHLYCRKQRDDAYFQKHLHETRQHLVVDLIVIAARQGATVLATELLDSLEPEIRSVAFPRIATAYAETGQYAMASGFIEQIDDEWRRTKTLTQLADSLARSGNANQAIQLIESAFNDQPEHRIHCLSFVVKGMADHGGAEIERLDLGLTLVAEIFRDEISVSAKTREFLVDVLLERDEVESALRLWGEPPSPWLLIGSESLVSRSICRHVGQWLKHGERHRLHELTSAMSPNQLKCFLQRMLNDESIEDDATSRTRFLKELVEVQTTLLNSDENLPGSVRIYSVLSHLIELGEHARALEFIKKYSGESRPGSTALVAAAMLRSSPDRETDRAVDELIAEFTVGSNYGWTELLKAKLECGFTDSAAALVERLQSGKWEMLFHAGNTILKGPHSDTLFAMIRDNIGDEFMHKDHNWAPSLYETTPVHRLETLRRLHHYFPDDHWANRYLAYALAENGRVSESLEQARITERLNREIRCFRGTIEKLCKAGKAAELLSHAREFGMEDREFALRWIAPSLAEKNEAKALELAREIGDPKLKSLALALVAKTMIDKRLGVTQDR